MQKSVLDKYFYRVTLLDVLLFTNHLGIMLKSGVPLSEAVESLKDQIKNVKFKNILNDIYLDITNGQDLQKSLEKYPHVFDSLYRSLVGIGEKSGKLEENLQYLAIHLRKKYDFDKKVQAAMLYPELVLAATAIIGGSMSLFVLPKLTDLFSSFEVELPLATKILLFIANSFKNYGIIIVASLILLFIGFTFLISTKAIRPKWQEFLLSLPFIGILIQEIELTSLCRNIGIMLKSGLPITSALEAQYQATDNLVFKKYLENIFKAMDKGKTISEEMTGAKYKYIPQIVPKMLAVGEKTGKLEEVFLYMGDFFEEEVDNTTKNLSNILEPVLLLVIGLVVGFVSIAIISPIYELTGSIRK